MSYNFLNFNGTLKPSALCFYDSNIGYSADFSVNGEFDGWTYYTGVHTYGCWNNFLFGTLYGSQALIGRDQTLLPLAAEDFYHVKIVMRFALTDRTDEQSVPTTGKIAWRTLSNNQWSSDKEYEFELETGNEWHTYLINMGEAQYWQGDISDIRIYPIYEDGRDGDEFFIRSIEILSNSTYRCKNLGCSYYSQYEHNCPGVGERGYCKSQELAALVEAGTIFSFSEDEEYTIEEGVNDTIALNINDYGFENVVIDPVENVSGDKLATLISKEIAALDVGGYAECEVEYTSRGAFIIYSGTYRDDSTVRLADSTLARYLNFYNDSGQDQSTKVVGETPATGFIPLSSFKLKTHQIYGLVDSSETTEYHFNPFVYAIEGGRRDWLETGLGNPTKDVAGTTDDASGMMHRSYAYIENSGRTIIDFSHPFNASGRIKKIYAGVTLDTIDSDERGANDSDRKDTQLSGAKIMFFRPLKDGSIRVLPDEVVISDRDHDSGKIYGATQEFVELDCDVFVNKGDLIGVYNANAYIGFSITGEEIDAAYYQVSGKASGDLEVDQPKGQGSAGLMFYARSDYQQNRLVLDLDLGKRVNVENINISAQAKESELEYNVARCLDINWEVDLFGEDHTTGYIISYRPLEKAYFNHPNLYYGLDCLSDGIKTVPDGLAADSFTVEGGIYYSQLWDAQGHQNGGDGVILTGAKYFSVNGDCEWLGIYQHQTRTAPFSGEDFSQDPIAFTLKFPYNKDKTITKSRIYFKERFNARSFAISTYGGPYYFNGDADDEHFDLIPYRDDYNTPWTSVSLDGVEYTPEEDSGWSDIDLYLAHNPTVGHTITQESGPAEISFDESLSYYDELGGLEYYNSGSVLNNDQRIQAAKVDWTILEHKWPAVEAAGYRFYCDYHESTKITEFEVFCSVEHIQSSMEGSLFIDYSAYGDVWWSAAQSGESYGVRGYIGDTPRYITLTLTPITEISMSDIELDISYGDVFMGDKGCQYTFLPTDTKLGGTSEPMQVDFKNVYGREYDLYVDVDAEDLVDTGAVFYSIMNNAASITNPRIGADAYYKKHEDYYIRNYNKNVAINCPVYKLKNLLDGANVWYSYDDEYSWRYYGQVADGDAFSFSNLEDASNTVLDVPVLTRSKWWKVGFLDPRVSMTVKEMKLYYQGNEITDVTFYHHKNQDAYTGSNTDTSPHLQDGIVDGSYYILTGEQYIGFEFTSPRPFDKIVFYNPALLRYENSPHIAGIDECTGLCLHGDGDTYQTSSIEDISYYEHSLQILGSNIYCDKESTDINYSFTEDFYNRNDFIETFNTFNPSEWIDVANATSYSGTVHITNVSGTGEITKPDIYSGNFEAVVELAVINPENVEGWGCYLEAFNSSGYRVRIGRTYHSPYYHTFYGKAYSSGGWGDLYLSSTSATEGMFLRIVRWGNDTTVYARVSGTWNNLGTTSVLGSDDVQFKLICERGPQATIDTTGVFDNLYILTKDSDWKINTDFNSTFTCVSGLSPATSSGWAYQYDMGVNDGSYAGGYKNPQIFDTNYNPIDQDYAFTFKFTFQTDEFLDYSSNSSNQYGVSVGILGRKVRWYKGVRPNRDHFSGAQVVLRRDDIGIAVQNIYCEGSAEYVSLDTSAKPYYCTFSGTGTGTYSITVWDDGWDGSNQVAFLSRNVGIDWWAGKIGVGASHTDDSLNRLGRATGWVSDFDFTCSKTQSHLNFSSSIKFGGLSTEYIKVDYDNNSNCNLAQNPLDFSNKRFTLDFHIMFNTIPIEEGEQAWIAGSWHPSQATTGTVSGLTPSSWLLFLDRDGTLKFIGNEAGTVHKFLDYEWQPDPYRWYHVMLVRGLDEDEFSSHALIINGHAFNYSNNYSSGWLPTISTSEADIIIGRGFDGWIDELRISGHESYGGGRSSSVTYYQLHSRDVPTEPYQRYYTMSLFESTDNIYYGKHMDVDVVFDNSYSYHEPDSVWSETYDSVLAIDFGRRHTVGLVRSYPINTSFQFTIDTNVTYSNVDTDDPYTAFAGSVSTYEDARWVQIRMPADASYTIENAGFYPDITVYNNKVGEYNCDWESLGTAITSYAADENIALAATVSGSSAVGYMEYANVTNGIIDEGNFDECWGADEYDTEPYVTIELPTTEQIYRVKIYHGYDDEDTYNLVTDYKVQTSTDNENFTTIFDISSNTSFTRTHDLVSPVTTKYIRILITGYNAIERYVFTGEDTGYQYWTGAVLREVEVYKYYGFEVIESETSPIIAIDLQDAFFVDGHELIGPYTENSSYDWSNDDSNFTYATSNLSDPRKVSFRSWGSSPGFEKWVAIMRNTATDYPTKHTSLYPQTDMPDYLKHAVIKATSDRVEKPNPTEYYWMWRSSISTVSNDYSNIYDGDMCDRSLKVEYPASTTSEHLYFIEGDTFGIDNVTSWRDGLNFYWYIDDVNNLDLEYGYIYFGGFDYTPEGNRVVHRWNMTSISGSLQTGWNDMYLIFMESDTTTYTELSDPTGRDPRRLYTVEWGSFGIVFRGKGNTLDMNIDGFKIKRNHFDHTCFLDKGLYLHAGDMMKLNVGELDFHSGAVEFFIRPDWDWDGRDAYEDSKQRVLFNFANVNNDVFGALVSAEGIQVYYGNLLEDFNVSVLPTIDYDILDQVTHMAFVFSADGEGISSDGSTVRVYVNNALAAVAYNTWEVSDDRHFNFFIGGQGMLTAKSVSFDPASSSVDGVLSRLRIHNYCKTDYSDSIAADESVDDRNLSKPSTFIEISTDNVTYHKVGSSELPFYFPEVPAGDTVSIWVKVSLPENLTGAEKRTAKLIGSWDIGV